MKVAQVAAVRPALHATVFPEHHPLNIATTRIYHGKTWAEDGLTSKVAYRARTLLKNLRPKASNGAEVSFDLCACLGAINCGEKPSEVGHGFVIQEPAHVCSQRCHFGRGMSRMAGKVKLSPS